MAQMQMQKKRTQKIVKPQFKTIEMSPASASSARTSDSYRSGRLSSSRSERSSSSSARGATYGGLHPDVVSEVRSREHSSRSRGDKSARSARSASSRSRTAYEDSTRSRSERERKSRKSSKHRSHKSARTSARSSSYEELYRSDGDQSKAIPAGKVVSKSIPAKDVMEGSQSHPTFMAQTTHTIDSIVRPSRRIHFPPGYKGHVPGKNEFDTVGKSYGKFTRDTAGYLIGR